MSYNRYATQTGTNNVPLGTRRRFGGGATDDAQPPPPPPPQPQLSYQQQQEPQRRSRFDENTDEFRGRELTRFGDSAPPKRSKNDE
ncbi:hypothetical protein HDU79_010911, partial [Rhizoclosmatium sp. JEL0117]